MFPVFEEAISSSETTEINSDFVTLVVKELNRLITKIDIETLLSVLYSIEQDLWGKYRYLQKQLENCSGEIKKRCEKYRISITSLYTT